MKSRMDYTRPGVEPWWETANDEYDSLDLNEGQS